MYRKGMTYQELDSILLRHAKEQPRAMNGGFQQALSAQATASGIQYTGNQAQTPAASGAIVPNAGAVCLSLNSVMVMTLALPVAGTDDFKELTIFSTHAQAHTVTTPANGLDGNKHIATFAALGDSIKLIAFNGTWWVLSTTTTLS